MHIESSSFRDPSGFIFYHQDQIYRNIQKGYGDDYDLLISSGLLKKLQELRYLIAHEVASLDISMPGTHAVLKPEKIPVITYPYEWSFSQLKDAALLTLEILKISLAHGMILKDASAFNIQFLGYQPILIDTLSFTRYDNGQPWNGYRQFCEHFLAPLCLSAYLGVGCQTLLNQGLEGVNLKLASKLLPWHSWLSPAVLFHIHLHARAIGHYGAGMPQSNAAVKKIRLENLSAMLSHLQTFIKSLKIRKLDNTQWKDYHTQTHYLPQSKEDKAAMITHWVKEIDPATIWDVGANDGTFSRLVVDHKRIVLSLDSDILAIERNYLCCKEEKIANVIPLVVDITNPSANIGWANQERRQLSLRSKPDLIMALAVIHHLVITFNIPFSLVAKHFASLSPWLIIEFVPENDDKIILLPRTAGKNAYNRTNFNEAFLTVFDLVSERKIEGSERSLLLLKRK